MAQFARPISDIQFSSITGTYLAIDEITASDSDFLYSADNTNTVYECLLSTINAPSARTSHTFKYRVGRTYSGVLNTGGTASSVTVALYQGATLIESDTIKTAGAWTTYTFNVSQAQAETITNYADLRLVFTISGGGGSPSNRRGVGISWAELSTPDGITAVNTTANSTSLLLATALLSVSLNANANKTVSALNETTSLNTVTVNAYASKQVVSLNNTYVLNSVSVDNATNATINTTSLTLNDNLQSLSVSGVSNKIVSVLDVSDSLQSVSVNGISNKQVNVLNNNYTLNTAIASISVTAVDAIININILNETLSLLNNTVNANAYKDVVKLNCTYTLHQSTISVISNADIVINKLNVETILEDARARGRINPKPRVIINFSKKPEYIMTNDFLIDYYKKKHRLN